MERKTRLDSLPSSRETRFAGIRYLILPKSGAHAAGLRPGAMAGRLRLQAMAGAWKPKPLRKLTGAAAKHNIAFPSGKKKRTQP